MEEERLIPIREKKSERTLSSSSTLSSHDGENSTISRLATSQLVSTSRDKIQGESSSSQGGYESSHKRTYKKLSKGEKSMISAEGTSGVNVGWTETRTTHGDDGAPPKYTDVADHEADPPQYCKGWLPYFAYTGFYQIPLTFTLAVDYSSICHLLELTEGETDLDSDKEIPDIFSKVE